MRPATKEWQAPGATTQADTPKKKKEKKSVAAKAKEPAQSFAIPDPEPEMFQINPIADSDRKTESQQHDFMSQQESLSKKSAGKKSKKSNSIETEKIEPEQNEEHADLVQSTNAILNGMC